MARWHGAWSFLPSHWSASTSIWPSLRLVRVTRRGWVSQVYKRPWTSKALPVAPLDGSRKSAASLPEVHFQILSAPVSLNIRMPALDQAGPSVKTKFLPIISMEILEKSWAGARATNNAATIRTRKGAIQGLIAYLLTSMLLTTFLTPFTFLAMCSALSFCPWFFRSEERRVGKEC